MSGAPQPLPRRRVAGTAPIAVVSEDLYGGDSDEEQQITNQSNSEQETSRLRERVAQLENAESQARSEVARLQERIGQLERENAGLKKNQEFFEEEKKQKRFEMQMEEDMLIRRKKALDDKEFRIGELEDEIQEKLKSLSISANQQNATAESNATKEAQLSAREVQLLRNEERLKCLQDELYEREGRLSQNETLMREKFKRAVDQENRVTEQMHLIEWQKQEMLETQPHLNVGSSPVARERSQLPQQSAAAVPSSAGSSVATVGGHSNTGDTNIDEQRKLEEYYLEKRKQEELDKMIALQYMESGFEDDTPSLPQTTSEPTDTTIDQPLPPANDS